MQFQEDPIRWREAAHEFWSWLYGHQAELDSLQDPDDAFFDELLLRLQALDDGLWFEFSSGDARPRELVLTAQGDAERFSLVEALVALAPPLDGWQVVALKPPMGFEFDMHHEGLDLQPGEMWFQPLHNEDAPHLLGLRVAVPGYMSELEDDFEMGVLVLLDTALGERAAATQVELLDVCEPPTHPPEAGFFPLADLGDYLVWRAQQKHGA